MKELTTTEVIAEYISESAMIAQPERVFRLQKGNHRYYYTFNEEGEPIFYTSVTKMITKTLPKNEALTTWMVQNFDTMEDYYLFLEDKADYGTFMHIEISKLLIERTIDLDSLEIRLEEYISENNLGRECLLWAPSLKKDLIAFAQFVFDKNVKPIAIEMVLVSQEMEVGGALDLVCELDFNSKRVIALIDNKSGRKGFHESHEIQLHVYAEMWNKWFPDKPVEMVFNWSPKDWRGDKPTYNFKNQTKSLSKDKIKPMIEINRINNAGKDKAMAITGGVIDLNSGTIENNIELLDLTQIAKNYESQNNKTN